MIQTILKIDSQLGKNASQTAIQTRLTRALLIHQIRSCKIVQAAQTTVDELIS